MAEHFEVTLLARKFEHQKNEENAMTRYAGLTLEQIEEVVKKLGGTQEVLALLCGDREVRMARPHKQMARLVEAARKGFSIRVDYGQSLSEMIKASNFDLVDDRITEERFPLSVGDAVERQVWVMRYFRGAPAYHVRSEMDAVGCEPACIEDLLAFGTIHPEEQERYPILIALGAHAMVRDEPYAMLTLSTSKKRELHLEYVDGLWFDIGYFLARNKVYAT